MKTNTIFQTALLLLCIVSCKKFSQQDVVKNNESTDSFSKIKTDPSFNWKNEQTVTFNVTPLFTPITITNTIQVADPNYATTYLIAKIDMDKAYSTLLLLPNTVDSVEVSFGTITKMIKVINKEVLFDFETAE